MKLQKQEEDYMNTKTFYDKEVRDEYAVYLNQNNYQVHGDGIGDDTLVIQQAAYDVWNKYGFGIVFIPEGTYLISDTIYIPKAVRLIGYGKQRPCMVLKDHAPGFNREYPEDKGKSKYLFWFADRVPQNGEAVRDANPGTFYSALSNVDIKLGEGNPHAVALRTHYAQHSFLAHMDIFVESGKAGIFDVGNEMEDIRIHGGDYGIITTKCSPGWPFVMVDTYFEGQRKAAIKSQESGLTIIRTTVRNTPVFLTVNDNYMEKLYLEDSVFENITETAIAMSCEKNAMNQFNLRNIVCNNVPVLVTYKESGRQLTSEHDFYRVNQYIHGVSVADVDKDREMITVCELEELKEQPEEFRTDIPKLPDMDTWINIKDLGAQGDGKSDDTATLKEAVEKYDTIYFPQGWYVITDTITLKEKTALIGLNPISTQLVLPDNTENFDGFGGPKPLIETPRGGSCIINGIGVDAGGRNPRAVACRWMSGETSFMNDVKFIGGHGTMEWGNNNHVRAYNETRTADANPHKMWDSQYPSLWVTNGGGGVFKDIWSASPYAAAGFYASDTNTRTSIYCMSLEHHVRSEARFKNVSNFRVFGLQTEEEKAEGMNAMPLDLDHCRDMLFANLYMFRVVYVTTPFPYCMKTNHCENVEFLNVHNYSQMKYTIDNTLYDWNTDYEVRPWELTRLYISGKAKRNPYELASVTKLYGGFRFADGGCSNSKGDFYFIDSTDKKIYKISHDTLEIAKVCELPVKPNSLAVDTEDNLIVVGEYVIPQGATCKGEPIINQLPPDSHGTSYGYWYNRNAVVVVFALDENDTDQPIRLLKKLKRSEVLNPEKIIYSGNRWRDASDFTSVVVDVPNDCYVAPDGKTIIPDQYDLIRANCLGAAYPGEFFYCVDEYYKRVYRLTTDKEGKLSEPVVAVEEGDFCVLHDKKGLLYVCDAQIRVYNEVGMLIKEITVPERPSTIAFGGSDHKTLFITARTSVYAVRL
ncbi:MAG: SMP-30/Gluconolaconase/LRE-like region-containing protein [Herbinix sp.]|nr:SMP-30/Gluconolaconase/LRE-like region-containing protein [Herbinix sp.]